MVFHDLFGRCHLVIILFLLPASRSKRDAESKSEDPSYDDGDLSVSQSQKDRWKQFSFDKIEIDTSSTDAESFWDEEASGFIKQPKVLVEYRNIQLKATKSKEAEKVCVSNNCE